eukprot:g19538.t1
MSAVRASARRNSLSTLPDIREDAQTPPSLPSTPLPGSNSEEQQGEGTSVQPTSNAQEPPNSFVFATPQYSQPQYSQPPSTFPEQHFNQPPSTILREESMPMFTSPQYYSHPNPIGKSAGSVDSAHATPPGNVAMQCGWPPPQQGGYVYPKNFYPIAPAPQPGSSRSLLFRQAYYNAAANAFMFIVALSVYHNMVVFNSFLHSLFWACLCGVFVHPTKRSLVRRLDRLLAAAQKSRRPLPAALARYLFLSCSGRLSVVACSTACRVWSLWRFLRTYGTQLAMSAVGGVSVIAVLCQYHHWLLVVLPALPSPNVLDDPFVSAGPNSSYCPVEGREWLDGAANGAGDSHEGGRGAKSWLGLGIWGSGAALLTLYVTANYCGWKRAGWALLLAVLGLVGGRVTLAMTVQARTWSGLLLLLYLALQLMGRSYEEGGGQGMAASKNEQSIGRCGKDKSSGSKHNNQHSKSYFWVLLLCCGFSSLRAWWSALVPWCGFSSPTLPLLLSVALCLLLLSFFAMVCGEICRLCAEETAQAARPVLEVHKRAASSLPRSRSESFVQAAVAVFPREEEGELQQRAGASRLQAAGNGDGEPGQEQEGEEQDDLSSSSSDQAVPPLPLRPGSSGFNTPRRRPRKRLRARRTSPTARSRANGGSSLPSTSSPWRLEPGWRRGPPKPSDSESDAAHARTGPRGASSPFLPLSLAPPFSTLSVSASSPALASYSKILGERDRGLKEKESKDSPEGSNSNDNQARLWSVLLPSERFCPLLFEQGRFLWAGLLHLDQLCVTWLRTNLNLLVTLCLLLLLVFGVLGGLAFFAVQTRHEVSLFVEAARSSSLQAIRSDPVKNWLNSTVVGNEALWKSINQSSVTVLLAARSWLDEHLQDAFGPEFNMSVLEQHLPFPTMVSSRATSTVLPLSSTSPPTSLPAATQQADLHAPRAKDPQGGLACVDDAFSLPWSPLLALEQPPEEPHRISTGQEPDEWGAQQKAGLLELREHLASFLQPNSASSRDASSPTSSGRTHPSGKQAQAEEVGKEVDLSSLLQWLSRAPSALARVPSSLASNVMLAAAQLPWLPVLRMLSQASKSFLDWLFGLVVFVSALYFSLVGQEEYKPVQMVTSIFPSGPRQERVQRAISRAVRDVFLVSIKLYSFHFLLTWLTFAELGSPLVYLPSVANGILAVVPIAPPFLLAIPLALYLWLSGSALMGLCLFLLHWGAYWFVDPAIHAEIKGSNPYLTALSIVGGITAWGASGAIIGPMLVCSLMVIQDILHSLLGPEPGSAEALPSATALPAFAGYSQQYVATGTAAGPRGRRQRNRENSTASELSDENFSDLEVENQPRDWHEPLSFLPVLQPNLQYYPQAMQGAAAASAAQPIISSVQHVAPLPPRLSSPALPTRPSKAW